MPSSSRKSFKPTAVPFRSSGRTALKILLYEHVSSGGYADETIPTRLLSEGFAMLRGLAEDFKAAGHQTTVLLDARIAAFHPPIAADEVVQIGDLGVVDQSMEKIANTIDAAFVVAPEFNHILTSIVECLETTGAFSLNCESQGIGEAADKPAFAKRAGKLGLSFPKTEILSATMSAKEAAQQFRGNLTFPLVAKPVGGAGCSGLSLIRNEGQLGEALAKVNRETASSQVIVQELVSGVPASVSLISTGEEAQPISLNLQTVTMAAPNEDSIYVGGAVPLDHPVKKEALAAAKRLVESFGTLRGYVGVDMVLAKDKAYIIEVNPRLTTSYVGLRKIADFNVADAIAQAVLKGIFPKKSTCKGYACFEKVLVNSPSALAWETVRSLADVASPPFPLANTSAHYALVQSCAATFVAAQAGLREAKKRVQQICKGGKSPR
jgi:tyramine---L-glutamate ligase